LGRAESPTEGQKDNGQLIIVNYQLKITGWGLGRVRGGFQLFAILAVKNTTKKTAPVLERFIHLCLSG